MWKGRAAGFPLGSKVCTCIWDGSFLRPTVIIPGETCSSMALPIVAAKLVLAAPCNGIFQVIMYSLTPLNSHLSIIYPRAMVPSALITQANLFSNSGIATSRFSPILACGLVALEHRAQEEDFPRLVDLHSQIMRITEFRLQFLLQATVRFADLMRPRVGFEPQNI